MAVLLNDDLVLWSCAVVQPASAPEIFAYISALIPDAAGSIDKDVISSSLKSMERRGLVLCVIKKFEWYAVTAKCNRRLTKDLRVARDSARLFLMRRRRGVKLLPSGGSITRELDGDSLPVDERLATQGAARPINSSVPPRATRLHGRINRPRIIQQLGFSVGSEADLPDYQLRYGSFATVEQVRQAGGLNNSNAAFSLDELALCIGVTPALLRSIILHKPRHYREFRIPKRSGGERTITAPRVFLKAIQQWIADHLFFGLPVHDSCHSYRIGHSIQTNARLHLGREYVACLDIQEFFPSIDKSRVVQMLVKSGLWEPLANIVASLCTLNQRLPQGAPSSPAISNSYLYDVDRHLFEFAESRGASYSRYADDITFSANDKKVVLQCIEIAASQLGENGLLLNADKTRVISRQGQQRVTGIVVNEYGYPPRSFRRRVRAAFHRADANWMLARKNYRRLLGYLSYLRQFEGLRDSNELRQFAAILARATLESNGD